MASKSIKVNGAFIVTGPFPHATFFRGECYRVINQGNVECKQFDSHIAETEHKVNAHWITNALNMMMAIDESKILQNMEITDAC